MARRSAKGRWKKEEGDREAGRQEGRKAGRKGGKEKRERERESGYPLLPQVFCHGQLWLRATERC